MYWSLSPHNNALLRGEELEAYTNLRDIRLRREYLLKEIQKEQKTMGQLRQSLFKKDSPSKRGGRRFSLSAILTAGGGILDGALLAWKLYRRFKKK